MKLDAIKGLAWHRVVAASMLCLVLSLYTVLSLFGFNPGFSARLLVALWSMQLAWLYLLFLLIPCFDRIWASALLLFPLALLFAWQTASVMLYHIQCRFFSFDELAHLLSNAHTRPLVLEQVFSFQFLLFLVIFYLIYYTAERLLKYFLAGKEAQLTLVIPVVLVLLIWGQFLNADYDQSLQDKREQRMCCMAWALTGDPQAREPVADPIQAQAHWYSSDQPFWAAGSLPLADQLAGRYQGRNVVIILLESHGLVQVDGLGKGSRHYHASSPHLARLAEEHICFTNYIQSGYTTATAAWSLLSGFPFFFESKFSPHLVRLGPVNAFQQAGYEIEWLKAADVHYSNFHELAANLDMRAGLSEEEHERMRARDDSLWSAWGMPDEQLYEIAWERIAAFEQRSQPYVQFILSVSNHNPFALPRELDGVRLTRNSRGGMRYADYCMAQYVKRLRSLPPDEQPLIVITADTSYRIDDALMQDGEYFFIEPLESLRIPCVLILPDDTPAQKVESMFTHQDLLPLLAHVLGIETRFSERVAAHHRVAVPVFDFEDHLIVTPDYYRYATGDILGISDRWQLSFHQGDHTVKRRLQHMYSYMHHLRDLIWPVAAQRVHHRWDNRDLIDSYAIPSDPSKPYRAPADE